MTNKTIKRLIAIAAVVNSTAVVAAYAYHVLVHPIPVFPLPTVLLVVGCALCVAANVL